MKKDLKDYFNNWDCSKMESIIDNISSKTVMGEIFPPYVPFVGKDYKKYRTLFYSTANNFSPVKHKDKLDIWTKLLKENEREKLVERLYYTHKFAQKYPDKNFEVPDFIGSYGVVWGIIGLFLYARHNYEIYEKRKIVDKIALSNFFKFSLRNGEKDLNPNKLKKSVASENNYLKCNYELVEKEIQILRPKTIIIYKGDKQSKFLTSNFNGIEVKVINDPAWIWRGGNGYFAKNGKWTKEVSKISDRQVKKIAEYYSEWCKKGTEKMQQKVKTYLLYYFKHFST